MCASWVTDTIHQIVTVIGMTFTTAEVHAGFGKHITNLSLQQLMTIGRWIFISEVVSIISIYFVRISVCFFVLRMISRTHKIFRRVVIGLMALLSVLVLVNLLIFCLQCIPIEHLWNPELPAHCLASSRIYTITQAFNGNSDPHGVHFAKNC